MKRPKRKKAKEEAVKLAIKVLETKVERKFKSRKFLSKHKIHKNPGNKYFNIFLDIVEYLEEVRGDSKNHMSSLLKDYFMSVYQYYSRFGRIPAVNQLSASMSNRIRFEEWIRNIEFMYDEGYFVDEILIEEGTEFDISIDKNELPNFIEV